ncbi:hypothetical protein B0H15DRAFT_807086 [Mycena belliarum]|uniref:CxC2-like cysteine cluster KDZ transposase-associated domain-containing protein n=1 Tax=Mycena belliarum TaxID=1033014 RepID=A0AAD6TM15_9AGAR|nr:hypothetical protein B0H15DRAFT_807086 [Mycena belliae]
MHEWRHLLLLKRGGVGNNGECKVADTGPEELAVLCPACPRPGVNLPDDWESASDDDKFLYIIFLAIDACFRLKRRLVSSELKDPGLGTGWAYFTEDTVFHQKEMSTCSGLAALDYANTKFSRGYGSTGVGLGVCARHEFVQLTAAVDLQRGESFSHMIYLVDHLKTLPPDIRLTLILVLCRFVIPKLHIYGHKMLCQLYFSLNYTPGAAHTDGEGIERPWANIGPVATSTREMGPGSRHDTLDDHWSHWNWQKLVRLGVLLKKRLLTAIPERNFQQEVFQTFTENQLDNVSAWKAMVVAFEADPTKPNPYRSQNRFVKEEAAEQDRGILPIHNISPSMFVLAGLDLEEQQCHIKVAVQARKSDTSETSAEIIKKRTKLSRYTARFRKIQAVYMPAALQALADRPAPAAGKEEEAALAENVPLFLPSALSEDARMLGCNKGVVAIEARLRDAQCHTSLDQIRNYLHVKSRFRTYKGGHIRMQAEKYVAAWEARRVLVGETALGWHRLDPKKDLRCMDEEEDRAQVSTGEAATAEDVAEDVAIGQRHKDPTGEGRRTMSWIWTGTDVSAAGANTAVANGLRVEWAKAWARMRRWTEEPGGWCIAHRWDLKSLDGGPSEEEEQEE